MAFFHVRIARKSNYPDEVRLDLTREQLNQKVVDPYNQGRPITVGGETLSLGDIKRITVNQTKSVSTAYRTAASIDHQLSPFNSFEWHVAAQGVDVTDEYITGPPGYGVEASSTVKQGSKSPMTMRVFISHSSNDVEVAKALIDLLRKALNLKSDEIRCTSVAGYGMPGGASVDETLKSEVHDAELLIGIITPASMMSAYVMFELGARWGAGKPMIPLLASGATPKHLEGPLAGINALDSSKDSQVYRLVEDSAGYLHVKLDRASSYATAVEELAKRSAKVTAPVEELSTASHSVHLSQEAKELLVEATDGREGIILMVGTMAGILFQANGKDFGDVGSRRSEAKWEQAIRDLLNLELIEDPTGKNEVFKVTKTGFEVADDLASSE